MQVAMVQLAVVLNYLHLCPIACVNAERNSTDIRQKLNKICSVFPGKWANRGDMIQIHHKHTRLPLICACTCCYMPLWYFYVFLDTAVHEL